MGYDLAGGLTGWDLEGFQSGLSWIVVLRKREATALTPGLEGPTVSPLRTEGWSAVRAMVAQTDTNRVMDELWELGARAILVTSIHASRL